MSFSNDYNINNPFPENDHQIDNNAIPLLSESDLEGHTTGDEEEEFEPKISHAHIKNFHPNTPLSISTWDRCSGNLDWLKMLQGASIPNSPNGTLCVVTIRPELHSSELNLDFVISDLELETATDLIDTNNLTACDSPDVSQIKLTVISPMISIEGDIALFQPNTEEISGISSRLPRISFEGVPDDVVYRLKDRSLDHTLGN